MRSWLYCLLAIGLLLGGFGSTAVPAGSTGSIARLHFQVACDTCAFGSTSDLFLTNSQEDMICYGPEIASVASSSVSCARTR